MKALMIII